MLRARTCAYVAATCALLVATCALLAGGAYGTSTIVVQPNGRVDGHTYREWLVKSWRLRLAKPPSAPLCQRVGNVEVMLSAKKSRATYKCSVPVGRAVYIPGWGAECSTIERAPFHGRTPAQLKRCARRYTKRAYSHIRWAIDGNTIDHPLSFVKASPVFRFHMPRHNILGLKKRSGRAAAYGGDFLLHNLAVGPHVIARSDRFFGVHYETTYRIRVNG